MTDNKVVTLPTEQCAGCPAYAQLEQMGIKVDQFERIVALRARTHAIARNIAEFLRGSDPFAKTIVFCVDQEHAEEMRQAINNHCSDLVQAHPDYVVRVVADEGDVGRGYLSRFQELERSTPVVVTTSKLLTTGVDVQRT